MISATALTVHFRLAAPGRPAINIRLRRYQAENAPARWLSRYRWWAFLRSRLSAPLLAPETCPELLQYLINGEARRLLPWWVVLERRQEPAHHLLCRHQQVGVIEDPVPVGVRGDIRKLERIRPQIVHLWNPQRYERLRPDLHGALQPLLRKDQLPIVIPHG